MEIDTIAFSNDNALTQDVPVPDEKSEIPSPSKQLSESVTNISSLKIDHKPIASKDLSTFCFESSSEYSNESKNEEQSYHHPFGDNYISLSHEIINNNKKKLGIINLFWSEDDTSLEGDAKDTLTYTVSQVKSQPKLTISNLIHSSTSQIFPPEYKTNSNKEKVLLLYAENFRRQYHVKFPTKKPLLLAAANECGVQKMVSTTIRPTKLCYPEMHTWRGCANLVADHIVYQPLNFPHLMVWHSKLLVL